MSIAFGIDIDGDKRLERSLLSMEKKASKKIVRTAVRKGGNVVMKKARINAKSMVGGKMGRLLARNIVLRKYKKQRRSQFSMFVAMRAGVAAFVYKAKKWSKYPDMTTYIPAAIESGHTTGQGDAVPAKPFMRNAYQSAGKTAQRIVVIEIKDGVKNEFRK